MASRGVGTSVTQQSHRLIDALPSGINSDQMANGNLRRCGHNMGFVEYFDETTGEWTNLEDVPLFDTINCQLCNEPTQAHDIVAEIHFKDDQPVVGAWQCRKCKAVNG